MKNTPESHLPLAGLTLSPERWAAIAPKLASLLAELAKMEDLEAWELEPDTADAWGATTRVEQGVVRGER